MKKEDLRKDIKRRTDTNSGEERTHLENREDKLFAPNEDELLCPLTKKLRESASDAVSRFSRLFFVYNKKNINHFLVCNMKFSLSGRY